MAHVGGLRAKGRDLWDGWGHLCSIVGGVRVSVGVHRPDGTRAVMTTRCSSIHQQSAIKRIQEYLIQRRQQITNTSQRIERCGRR